MKKYRKKSHELEAVMVTDSNFEQVAVWSGGIITWIGGYGKAVALIVIKKTNGEGHLSVGVGDVLVKDVGQFCGYSSNSFFEEYEEVPV